MVLCKRTRQLPKTKRAQDRSPKCREPTPPALGGGRRAGKSGRLVGGCAGSVPVYAVGRVAALGARRGEPVGLIGGLCGSTSWVCLWDGHVGVFEGGLDRRCFLLQFLFSFFGLPPTLSKRVMVFRKRTRQLPGVPAKADGGSGGVQGRSLFTL